MSNQEFFLSDFISVKHGFAFKGDFITTEENENCLLTPGNFMIGGGFKSDKFKYFSGDIPQDYILKEDDLIITMTDLSKQGDTLGYSALVPSIYGKKMLHNQRIGLVEFKNNELDKYYLYFLLRSHEYRSYILGCSTGSTVRHTSPSKIVSFKFVKPDLETQKKIASKLLSLENKIDLNTQINQTLEQIAQVLFKSWFVDFDPVRAKVQALSDGMSLEQAELAAMQAISGKTPEKLTALSQTQPNRYAELAETAKAFPCEMVEVDGVEVPKGWEVKALDEVANYQNGLALQKFRPENDEPFLPVVKIAQLRQGYADSDEKAKANIKPECIIDNGDVVFSWSGSLLVDIWCGGKAALNQHLFKVSSKEYPKWFYYFYTKHHLTEFQRIAYDKAVTMGHIKREHLSAAKCIVPNDELLANKTLENILEKIIFNRLENFNLQDTRDLLLPRLLNGEMIDA